MKLVKSQPSITYAIETVAIALAYFALARVGQIVAIEPGNVTPVWPASGMALAVVLQRGYRTWLGLWIGVVLGNTWAILDFSSLSDAVRTVATGIAIGPGAIGQAFFGSYLIRRYCRRGNPFGRTCDVLCFVGTQALACLISASLGVLALSLSGVISWPSFGATWLTWYLGDGVGVILFAPLVLTANANLPLIHDSRRLAESLVIISLSAVASAVVFSDIFEPSLSFLPLPLVLWAAVRGNQFVVSATIVVIAAVAVWGTANGQGPFATENLNTSLLVAQLYAATTAVTGSAVACSLNENRAAETELSRSDARLHLALRGGNVGLWDWDVESNSVYYSPQFAIQLGHDPNDSWNTYHEWESRLHPEDKADAVERVQEYLKGDVPEYTSTFRLRKKDGSYLWIRSQGEAEWDSQNRPTRMIGVHIDVTDIRLREQELERTNLELQQMAYASSHDLQEPLRSITSFSQLVDRTYRDQLDDNGRAWLDAIIRSTARMKSLVQDLTSYSQLEAPVHAFEAVDLKTVVEDALISLGGTIGECGAEVTHDELPTIMGNRSQLVQLFQNLIGNAIKYRNEHPVRVHVSAVQDDGRWLVSIEDNGIGIESKHFDVIFEVFRRLHHVDEQPGTGIGLAICRRVVNRHHGEIWVESTPGQGSTFYFSVPVRRAVEDLEGSAG